MKAIKKQQLREDHEKAMRKQRKTVHKRIESFASPLQSICEEESFHGEEEDEDYSDFSQSLGSPSERFRED